MDGRLAGFLLRKLGRRSETYVYKRVAEEAEEGRKVNQGTGPGNKSLASHGTFAGLIQKTIGCLRTNITHLALLLW